MEDARPWWLWPNLLSLDAPLIAVLWQFFLTREEGVEVPLAASITLGLVVWGIYLLDRCLDAQSGRPLLTDRHRFAALHRNTLLGLAFLALITAGIIALVGLPLPYWWVGGSVALLAMAYFAIVHQIAQQPLFKGIKEASVGVVFAVGVSIPLIVEKFRSSREWVPGDMAFAGLCVLNCLLISRWEENRDSAPSAWTVLAVTMITGGVAVVAKYHVASTVLGSLGLLIGLELLRQKLSRRGLRVLADAALLSPFVVMVWA